MNDNNYNNDTNTPNDLNNQNTYNSINNSNDNLEQTEVLETIQTSQSVPQNAQVKQNILGEQVVQQHIYEEEKPQFQEVQVQKQAARTDSYFDGGLLELIGWRILAGLITIITFGIGSSWGKCMLYNYQFKHTVYNGKRLKFEGTGGDLFVNRFKWIFLSIVTLGIYIFFIPVQKTKWVISNLHFEDESLVKGESFFDGKTSHLIGVNILCNILNAFSLGLLVSFTTCFKLKWINRHVVINKKKLVFTGKALNLFGKYLLWLFLTIITFGIYGWWLSIKVLKWNTKNTHIKVLGEQEVKDNSLAVAAVVGVIGFALFILVAPKAISLVTTGIDTSNGNSVCINPFTCIKRNDSIKSISTEDNYRRYDNTVDEVRSGY